MAARIDDLVDIVVGEVERKAASVAVAGITTTVTATDIVDVDSDDLTGTTLTVYVSPDGYEDGGPVTRGRDATLYAIRVTTVGKFTGDVADRDQWRRDRTEWVHEAVFKPLGDPRTDFDGTYADRIELTWDREELVERNLFWCDVLLTLKEE